MSLLFSFNNSPKLSCTFKKIIMMLATIVVFWLSMKCILATKDTVQSLNDNGHLSVELISKYNHQDEIQSGKCMSIKQINIKSTCNHHRCTK